MVKCESLRINMFRITHGKINKFSRNIMSILNLGVKLAERWKLTPCKLAFICLNKTLFGHVMSKSKIM